MQSVSSKIWTRVAVSISYDDNHYTTGTSKFIQEEVNMEQWRSKKSGGGEADGKKITVGQKS